MKRKLSLLMAAIMALSTLPFTATEVQANTTNRIHGIPGTTVPENTVFVEGQQTTAGWTPDVATVPIGAGRFNATGRITGPQGFLPGNTSAAGAALVGAGYAIHAGYLELELRSRQSAGDMFRFELDNGEWLFRSSQTAANNLITQFNQIQGATTGDAWDVAILPSNDPDEAGPGHGARAPGLTTLRDLVLLNSFQSRDNRAAASGFNGTEWILTLDGPLGISSQGHGIEGLGTATDVLTAGGMPPVVRPTDWNFPHGYPDNFGETLANGTVQRLGLPGGGAGTRIEEILNTPVENFNTEGPASGWAADRHRIGSGMIVNNINANVIGRTYDIRRGFFLRDTPGAEGSYVRFANAVQDTLGGRSPNERWTVGDAEVNATGTTIQGTTSSDNAWTFQSGGTLAIRSDAGTPQHNIEVPYVMDISRVAEGRVEATVTLLDNAEPTDIVLVPLVIRVPTSEGATIRLLPAGHLPFVTQGTWHIAAAGAAQTAAHVVNPVTARDKFELDALIIRELRANSIRRTGTGGLTNNGGVRNAFDLVLTSGFYFDPSVLTQLVLFLERDLTWQAIPTRVPPRPPMPGAGEIGVDYRVWFPEGHENSRDRLRIQMDNFNQSHLIEGSLAIYGLVIWAEETVPFDTDVEISLRNVMHVAPGDFWTQNATPGGMLPAPAPAGWVFRGHPVEDPALGGFSLDLIRPRVGNTGIFDLIMVDASDSTIFQNAINRGFSPRGPMIGWSTSNATFLNTDRVTNQWITDNVGTAASPTQTPWAFQERQFTVNNPGFGLVINELNEANMVTEQTIRAGTRRDWGIVLRTEGDVPELISGRYEGPTSVPGVEHRTARTVFEEVVPNSWWAGRQVILTLPEEVKWRRVWFQEIRYPPGSPAGNETIAPNTIQRQHYYVNIEAPPAGQSLISGSGIAANEVHAVGGRATTARHGVHFDENKMYWTDVLAWRGPQTGPGPNNTQNRGAYIRFDSWVSIAAPFEGDIILTASGTAVPTETNVPMPSAIIATALPPVRVHVEEITDLRIGFQHQPAFDIVITESRPGALMRERNVRLSITDLIATDIMFGPGVNVEVTNSQESGFTIRNISSGLAGSLYGGGSGLIPTMGIEANRGTISFDVASVSHRVPAIITVSNVSVRVDRTVPETNEVPYWVVVWGNAIANNFGHYDTRPVGQSLLNWPVIERTNLDRFMNHPGIFTDYLRVVSGGDGSPWLTQEVRVTIGELWYSVNGIQYEMDVAALLDPATSSTFVPLRFIANAFGLADDQIVWDNHNRTATIVLPTGRVVQFAADSPIMLDNGAPRNIVNAANEPISPMIVTIDENDGGRMFLPFRFFGEVVLGVPVDWEPGTQTAVFNPSGSLGR